MGDRYELKKPFPNLPAQAQPAVCRILDANLDRAREGLRIVEEWCRFGLDSSELAGECKQLRQEIAKWHTQDLRAFRDTLGDVGTDLSHPQEEERAGIQQLLQANLCRIEEALRVLEEYGKLYHPEMGTAFKQMRYRIYTLESNLLGYQRQQKLLRSHLYLVTSESENLFAVVEAALQGGLTLVQYRDKDADDDVRVETAQKLRQLCRRYEALFIVNDRVDLALAVDADGVHLGQQDLPIAMARQLLGPHRIIGRSTTNPDEMRRAIAEGADYIGVGPVYETPTKIGKAAAGLEYVRYAAQNASVPWFAIGGIDPTNLNDVLSAGAERIAAVRAIMEAEQPTLVTQYFLSQLSRLQTLRALKAHLPQSHVQSNNLTS
ncbi:thiamine phosphate synthase [Planktothrix sp. FACHB-1355]|uniref:Thiamine-phosphate synthase n=1 Tax=Aerosakkonema funiforme FACHB-1375 TaxID=2949571 RepID=A0A926VDM5_9CYAN|nr:MULTISPECIES: thiamine phosphate synthase [Oscillatoriales]MBD2181780.1 thiamine phosphate synthase [Aerosakkonema funiforme FACHB-1375]MBD3563070.1 thiamine phosphate synthase [Planktothrix sp. FACHB-1355]